MSIFCTKEDFPMTFYREERRPPHQIENLFECNIQQTQGCETAAFPHVHEYYEALYCLEGSYVLYTGDTHCAFGVGDMVLIDPNEVHHTRSTSDGRNRYLVLKFAPDALLYAEHPIYEMQVLLPYFWMGSHHRKKFEKALLDRDNIGQLLLNILAEFDARALGYEMAVRADVCRLFLWVVRLLDRETDGSLMHNLDNTVLLTLQRAFAYVEANYTHEISMEEVAAHCGMKYSAFSRFFTKYAQKSFPDYLTEVRLKRADILLATTSLSVTDISMAIGFSTTSYFIQRFRARHGISPGKFRRQFLSGLPTH